MQIRNIYSSVAIAAAFLAMSFVFPVSVAASDRWDREFVHGITLKINGEKYYFEGAADGPNGEQDIPGHEWAQIKRNKYLAKHYNTGPFGAPQWWSSDAGDGELLWVMEAIIDTWTEAKAVKYYTNGYVHYHTLVSAKDGSRHPSKVAWLKHTAVTDFTFDGVPPLPGPEFAYEVRPGVDYNIAPNWGTPYAPGSAP